MGRAGHIAAPRPLLDDEGSYQLLIALRSRRAHREALCLEVASGIEGGIQNQQFMTCPETHHCEFQLLSGRHIEEAHRITRWASSHAPGAPCRRVTTRLRTSLQGKGNTRAARPEKVWAALV